MTDRMCVYTVVVGGTERLLEQPVAADSSIDFICLTDDLDAASESWLVKQIGPLFLDDPGRSSRRPKMLAHEYLADYDVSLYIDNTVLLLADPQPIIEEHLPAGTLMSIFRHSFRETVLDELNLVRELGLDERWRFDEQRQHYANDDPGSLSAEVLWGGMLLRRHHDPAVKRAMTTWWEHVLRYSRRDQLSLPFALRRNNLSVTVSRVDNHRSDFHQWPRARDRTGTRERAEPAGPEQTIRALESKVHGMQAAVERSEAELRQLRAHQKHLQAGVDEVTAALADRDRSLRVAEDRVAAAESSTAAALRRVDELLTSTSWRVTAPLRLMGSIRLSVKARRADRRPVR